MFTFSAPLPIFSGPLSPFLRTEKVTKKSWESERRTWIFQKLFPHPTPPRPVKSIFYHKECIRKLSLTGLGRSVILLQGPAGLPAPAGQCPLWGSVACRQRETRGLGGLPPRGPQLGERRAGNRAGEAGRAERKTIKTQNPWKWVF